MKGSKVFFAVLLFALSIQFFSQCDQPYCEEKGEVALNVGFYKYTNNIIADTLIDSVSIYIGPNLDTLFYNELEAKTNKVAFPLSPLVDTVKVVFQFNKAINDTLAIYYNRELRMVSHECGFVHFFKIDTITTTNNKIKSIWISKDFVEYGSKENIKIYF